MIYEIDLLTDSEVRRCNEQYDVTTTWKEGVVSGAINKEVKNSKQLDPNVPQYRHCMDAVQTALKRNKDLGSIYIIDDITPPLMTQYDTGGFYKQHVDAVDIQNLRTDHSITVFLNDPDEYEGGELAIQLGDIWHQFKLKAGKAIIYPTGLIHSVKPVTSGHRRVALMWAKSMVDDEFIRYQLIDFARAIKNLVPSHEDDSLLVPLEQVRSNILRAYGNLS